MQIDILKILANVSSYWVSKTNIVFISKLIRPATK